MPRVMCGTRENGVTGVCEDPAPCWLTVLCPGPPESALMTAIPSYKGFFMQSLCNSVF